MTQDTDRQVHQRPAPGPAQQTGRAPARQSVPPARPWEGGLARRRLLLA